MRFRFIPAKRLSGPHLERMHALMLQYYLDVPRDQFRKDLEEKTDIILLLDEHGEIQGFSTILLFDREIAGKRVSGVYSGDTVLNKDYWGKRSLTIAFGLYLAKLIFKAPWKSHYWFLMSKGYKTYLLMTHNTLDYYPRHDRATPPDFKSLIDGFYGGRYGKSFDADRGLVSPRGDRMRLKNHVADIEPRHLENPDIRFFAEKNPGWKDGIELTCVSRINVMTVVAFSFSLLLRQSKALFARREKIRAIV